MFDQILEKWSEILSFIQNEYELSDVSFRTWIEPLHPAALEGDTLFIEVPDSSFVAYITKKYTPFFQVAVEEKTSFSGTVAFCAPGEKRTAAPVKKPAEEEENADYRRAAVAANLNPRYTFSNFVVGANNKLAHAASLAVAESPGRLYNPLFIYGGPGLGKTHLMHSIANFILKNSPSTKVIFTTSENFTNELVEAIRKSNISNTATPQFREKYRNVDVLLIDDIQFIINKLGTQEEFFHTFNYLYENNKQVVISSDKSPKEFTMLEERLRSRFEMGLQVDISTPDYETRMAILRSKEEQEGYNIDNEILKYIASNIQSNIRELEGALNKIIAYSKLYKAEMTMETAEEALKDMISPDARREVTASGIISIVAEHYGFTREQLISPNRHKEIVYPRQIAMYLCRNMTSLSLQAIGTALGKKDHTTIMHGIDIIEHDLATDPAVRDTIDILKKKINPA